MLHGLLAVRQEEKTVSKKEQLCIVMRRDDFDNGTLLHAVAHYCKKVQQEGASEHYFIDASQDTVEDGTPVTAEEGNESGVPIPTILNNEDVSNFRAMGFVLMMTTHRHRKIYQHQMPILMNALTWNGIPFQLMKGE